MSIAGKFRSFMFACAASLLCAGPAFCAAGKVSDYYLRIVQSPRAAAMGESGSALPGDLLGALSLNPALLALSVHKEASFTYSKWIEDISLQQLAYVHPVDKIGAFAASGSMLQMKSFQGYDNSGNATGNIDSSDMAFGLSYARRVYGPDGDRRRGIFLGATVKRAQEKIEEAKASTTLFDLGAAGFAPAFGGTIGLGVSAQSLGQGFQFDSERDPAPTTYRAGVSYSHLLWGDPISLACDLIKNTEMNSRYAAGIDWVLWRTVAWRVGYISDQSLGSGVRFGAGFNLKVMSIDYALASFGDFGLTHRFGISFKFGKPIEMTPHLSPAEEKAKWHVERARKLMEGDKLYDSIIELDKALSLDPNNKEAVTMMQKARNLMESGK